MNRNDFLIKCAKAFREDRSRLFKITDAMKMQPKYSDKLEEIENICKIWRDKPLDPNFPKFDHPLPLPEYFENPHFTSRWDADSYLQYADIDVESNIKLKTIIKR